MSSIDIFKNYYKEEKEELTKVINDYNKEFIIEELRLFSKFKLRWKTSKRYFSRLRILFIKR